MYIIAVSGTHGTGKSTVMRGLDEMNIPTSAVQLSRTAQKYLGWESLSKAEESADDMWQLQGAILSLMFDRDESIIESKTVTFVERSPADLWAYTRLWCQRLNIDERDRRVVYYKNQLRHLASKYADVMILYPSMRVPFQAEKERADLKSRDDVQNSIIEFLKSGGLKHQPIPLYDKTARVMACAATYAIVKAQNELPQLEI